MDTLISQLIRKLTIFFPLSQLGLFGLLLMLGLMNSSCFAERRDGKSTQTGSKDLYSLYRKGHFILPSGKKMPIRILINSKEQKKGVSGLKKSQFSKKQGYFFFYQNPAPRIFWMPDTYFNLDIIFLNADLEILYIAKDVKAHPGTSNNPPIPKTKAVYCRHVLEIRADSEYSKELRPGMKLKFHSSFSLSQIESSIHQSQ